MAEWQQIFKQRVYQDSYSSVKSTPNDLLRFRMSLVGTFINVTFDMFSILSLGDIDGSIY
jgi:hypothetical protein